MLPFIQLNNYPFKPYKEAIINDTDNNAYIIRYNNGLKMYKCDREFSIMDSIEVNLDSVFLEIERSSLMREDPPPEHIITLFLQNPQFYRAIGSYRDIDASPKERLKAHQPRTRYLRRKIRRENIISMTVVRRFFDMVCDIDYMTKYYEW